MAYFKLILSERTEMHDPFNRSLQMQLKLSVLSGFRNYRNLNLAAKTTSFLFKYHTNLSSGPIET